MATLSFRAKADPDATLVFALIADLERRGEWQAGVSQVERLTPDPTTVGSRYRSVRRTPGGRVEQTSEVVALDAEQLVLVERVLDGPLAGTTTRWEVAQAAWSARVSISSETRVSGRLAPLAPLVNRRLRRDLGRTVSNLEETLREPR